MSISERLFMLAQQYRDQHGQAALADPGRLTSVLSSQAPDLHGEIRALAAAIAANAAGRIGQAADPQGESRTIAGQIAAEQTLPLASVTPAIEVATRLGSVQPAPAAASGNSWAGDTVIAGNQPAPPLAPPPPIPAATVQEEAAKPPVWQNKWAVGAAAAVLALMGYQQYGQQSAPPGAQAPQMPVGPGAPNAPVTPTGPQPPGMAPGTPPNAPVAPGQPGPNAPVAPGTPQGNGGQQFPALASPNGPQPMLMVQGMQNGFMVGFSLNGVAGMVASPQGGWDNGPGSIMLSRNPQSNQPDAIGGGMFQANNSGGGGPARLMQVQWQQDNLGIGPVCVAFIGNGGQDVDPRGARMCLMDGACNRPLGCGQLPTGQ